MIEIFKHLFGFCGEGHPTLIILLGATPLVILKTYIAKWCSYFSLSLKSYLKHI